MEIITSWVNYFHQVSCRWDKKCKFFTVDQFLNVSRFLFPRLYLWETSKERQQLTIGERVIRRASRALLAVKSLNWIEILFYHQVNSYLTPWKYEWFKGYGIHDKSRYLSWELWIGYGFVPLQFDELFPHFPQHHFETKLSLPVSSRNWPKERCTIRSFEKYDINIAIKCSIFQIRTSRGFRFLFLVKLEKNLQP